MCITIVCFPGCDIINFGINPIFLIKRFFYMTKKSGQKFKYLENKKKHFSSFLKGFQWPEIVSDLRGRLSTGFLGSGLKLIFNWKAQLLIFFKSLFSSFAEVFTSCVRENNVDYGLPLSFENNFLGYFRCKNSFFRRFCRQTANFSIKISGYLGKF